MEEASSPPRERKKESTVLLCTFFEMSLSLFIGKRGARYDQLAGLYFFARMTHAKLSLLHTTIQLYAKWALCMQKEGGGEKKEQLQAAMPHVIEGLLF